MLHERTHIHIDGKLHHIVEVQEHDGVRHTHRVHTGCGLTIDVDHMGAKHAAAAQERRTLAAQAKARKDQALYLDHTEFAEAAEARAKKHHDDVHDPKGRWRTLGKAQVHADCDECARVEGGGARVEREQGFNTPAKPIPGLDQQPSMKIASLDPSAVEPGPGPQEG